ncbi:MAG: arsenate reductase family protein [Alkalispirochaeta sp.]
MVPQIIGTKKSKGFRACERYCKERGITVQYRDPFENPLSDGEVESILREIGDPQLLIDTTSKAYRARGLAWIDYDPVEELRETPTLLRLPILRTDNGVAIAPDAETLSRFLA